MATEATKITYVEAAAPSTPAASRVVLYAKTDGLLYSKDDAGTETLVSGGAGGGSVATDAIWDAKGDLAAGTGANTAQKLTVGANGTFLEAQSGETTGLKWSALGHAKYKRTSGDYSTSSATFVDVDGTNLSLTITTGARRVMISFVGSVYSSNAAGAVALDVSVDGTRQGGNFGLVFVQMQGNANRPANGSFVYVTDALSAGSHTFNLKYLSTAGNANIAGNASAGSEIVCSFAVDELP